MKEQLENTVELISKKIEQLKSLKQENQYCINDASQYSDTPQKEVEDRIRLAAEYDKMLQFSEIEKEYFERVYLDQYREKFTNLPEDVIRFLAKIFYQIKVKLTDPEETKLLEKTLEDINKLPLVPESTCFISFDYENSVYNIFCSDYKIELTQWVRDYQEYSNDSYKEYCFTYDVNGYQDAIGIFEEFTDEIFTDIERVKPTDIYISEEE